MAWGFGNSGAASGGGFNRHDALLRVIAPARSTVTITKGAYHKTDYGHENVQDHTLYDYYFIIHQSQFDSQNAWSVTSTRTESGETETDSAEIIIDAADEYDVELSYFLYLLKDGDQCTDITGGWRGGYSNLDNTYNFDNNKLSIGSATAVGTNIKIDLTDYSKLVFIGKVLTHSGSQSGASGGVYGQRHNTQGIVQSATFSQDVGAFNYEMDISNLSGTPGYITCRCGNGSTNEFYRVYLSK